MKIEHVGVQGFENGISSKQFKIVNLIFVRKIRNAQSLKTVEQMR